MKPTEVLTAAYGEIKSDHSSDEPLLIYGYSHGGDQALQLTRALEDIGVKVDLLITVDAADGPFSDFVDRDVPANVEKNQNYYQEKRSFPLLSVGGANSRNEGNSNTQINNVNMTSDDTNHGSCCTIL